MSKKFIAAYLVASVIALGLLLNPALAKSNDSDDSTDQTIPEKNGTYNVPGRPDLKVRVFVHNPKVKPEIKPTPSPSLICDLNDPESANVVSPTSWHLPASWAYNLNPSSVPVSVGSANLAIIAADAFSRWSNASGSKVSLTRGSDTTAGKATFDRKNIIAWGRTSATALGITYIWYYPSTGLVAEVDTIMNKKFPWSWTSYSAQNRCADQNSYDAQNILTHELGHWMGLDDEYATDYQDNTMYGYGAKGEIKKDTLTSGDISGISMIYE